MKNPIRNFSKRTLWFSGLILAALIVTAGAALANSAPQQVLPASPMHPTFPLLDEEGKNVLESGAAISTMQTCGACHDTEFIASHSDHASLGMDQMTGTGARPWELGPGLFGAWNPLTYGSLSAAGTERVDLSTPDWVRAYAAQIVGGGPAMYSQGGKLLTDLPPSIEDLETTTLDPISGQKIAWDWQKSGVVEMNCFLCHTAQPDNAARVQTIQSGEFRWAATATLLQSGIVTGEAGQFQYAPDAFDENGEVRIEKLAIQDPSSNNCGSCHAQVHTDPQQPFLSTANGLEDWRALTTGEIISPQRMSDSGMNLQGKASLSRPFDVHAERNLSCTDCHYSLNNPVYFQEDETTRPNHLTFDPRRLELGEYLEKPIHQFARGGVMEGDQAILNTMRRCDGCHSIETTHNWLPYKTRHMEAVSCETCHIPKMTGAAFEQVDWTVLQADGQPILRYRGVNGAPGTAESLVTGYQPVLAPRPNVGGETRVAPYNLIGAWYWVYGNPSLPVRQADLQAAWLTDSGYAPEVLAAFDQDGDGALQETELKLDSDTKVSLIAARLEALGLQQPRIVGEVEAYSLNHEVATGEWATRECTACHGSESLLVQPMLVSEYLPGGVMPTFIGEKGPAQGGTLEKTDAGRLVYQPDLNQQGLYVFGHQRVGWVDLGGALAFLGVLLGVAGHSTFRFMASLRLPKHKAPVEKVYMYTVYERLWHWLQTFTILGLLFTGLVIHKPDTFGIFSFRYVVELHNILAAVLLINAGLSLFYHLVSGEIRQYLPRPAGFFDQAVQQAVYYLRGIFRGEPHPFEKTPEKKLNPLQQITYFAILNVLLPLQTITGILMWAAPRFPEFTARLGGLPLLAPFHTLIAWLFGAFIVAHVYLTTTGHTPLASIQAMMGGWDEVEKFNPAEEATE